MTEPERYHNKNVRVRGRIKQGSIVASIEDGRPLTHFTLLGENSKELAIISREEPPDSFEAGKMCIVEGRMFDWGRTDGYSLEATRITTKCPSKYAAEGDEVPSGAADLYEQYRSVPAR